MPSRIGSGSLPMVAYAVVHLVHLEHERRAERVESAGVGPDRPRDSLHTDGTVEA